MKMSFLSHPATQEFKYPSVRPSVNNLLQSFVFSATVIAANIKPCIVIVLGILFKHTP